MRPGITIAHARELERSSELVRSDITGFIGIVPRDRWPPRARSGDFLEVVLTSYGDLANSQGRHFFDPVTRRGVRSFFENGGDRCHLFGLCIGSEEDLLVRDPFATVFHSLLDRLRGEEDIGLLAMPALAYLPVQYDRRGRAEVLCQPVMELLLEHCREMNNRFLILDAPQDLHDAALRRWVNQFRDKNSESASYAAIYYPWLMDGDESFPPSGSMAGVFARLEREHDPGGIAWPPANQIVRGVTHPSVDIRWSETGELAEAGINPILVQPTRGVVVWGARTLSRDPRWTYINSRRIVSYISEQVRRDSAWVVFEHQRPELWKILERSVRSRLDMLWSAGLLSGDQASSGYLVKCDEELNPAEVRDAGQVHVKIMLKPVSTAEFVVVELRLGANDGGGGTL